MGTSLRGMLHSIEIASFRFLKCAIFLKENRILLLTDELDIPSRIELHECIRKFVDVDFEYRHFHGQFTISHVGHYPDLANIAAHVIVDGFDQSILEEDVVYEFPQTEPDVLDICHLCQKHILPYVQAMYPTELNNTQYWHLLRDRVFHGLPVNLRSNIRNEYEHGKDYYPLLQAAK